LAAVKAIIDGRDPEKDASKILVTAEHAFACVLLATTVDNPRMAAAMLNEGLIPGIEARLAYYASKRDGSTHR
jgi:hypothetical protein